MRLLVFIQAGGLHGDASSFESVRPGDFPRVAEKRQQPFLHRREREHPQIIVARRLVERPDLQGKVATVDVRASERVADAVLGIVIPAENLQAFLGGKLREHPRRGLSKRPTKPDNLL